MTDLRRPAILIVDDEEGQQEPTVALLARYGAEAWVRHPRDVERDDVVDADLVLVDFVLENWTDRPTQASISPANGLTLAAVLQGHANEADGRPTAFALRTGRPDKVPSQFPQPKAEHAFARLNNLEWVFPKIRDDSVDVTAQFLQLAEAVTQLPDSWEQATGQRELERLLSLEADSAWADDARTGVRSAFPPVHEMSSTSHGLAFVRWVLHRILPYPCFLWDATWLAARMGISRSRFDELYTHGLDELLGRTKYSGVLDNFLGTRWWRAGVEHVLWEATEGRSRNPEALHSLIQSLTGQEPAEGLKPDRVVVMDAAQEPMDEPLAVSEAVRIQPDDWPPYAEPAYTTREHALGELAPLVSDPSSLVDGTGVIEGNGAS